MGREKLATLKYYSVDSDGKIQRLRRECPSETCGAGIFLAFQKDIVLREVPCYLYIPFISICLC
jgi:ribosomal protein S27AE